MQPDRYSYTDDLNSRVASSEAKRRGGQDQGQSSKYAPFPSSSAHLPPSTLKSLARPGSAVALKRQHVHLREYAKDRLPGETGLYKYPSEKSKLEKFKVEGLDLGKKEKEAAAWEAFGATICNSMRQGRAVQVPKLGLFTFTAIGVDLKGTTNQNERDR